jgi:hypothetical protein
MNDTNPVSEAVQPISTDQKVGGSSPSKRTQPSSFSRGLGFVFKASPDPYRIRTRWFYLVRKASIITMITFTTFRTRATI